MKNIKVWMVALSIPFIITACGESKSKKKTTDKTEKPTETIFVPEFNADSAFAFIEKQVSFGARVPNTDAHKKCAVWLSETLKRYTSNVIVQNAKLRTSDNTTLDASNIIASFNPDNQSRILLCAHWDTRP